MGKKHVPNHQPEWSQTCLHRSPNVSPSTSLQMNLKQQNSAHILQPWTLRIIIVQFVQGTCDREVRQWLINEDGLARFAWRSQGSQARSEGSCTMENAGQIPSNSRDKRFFDIGCHLNPSISCLHIHGESYANITAGFMINLGGFTTAPMDCPWPRWNSVTLVIVQKAYKSAFTMIICMIHLNMP